MYPVRIVVKHVFQGGLVVVVCVVAEHSWFRVGVSVGVGESVSLS